MGLSWSSSQKPPAEINVILKFRELNILISAIFKDKKNADKFNRNKPADVKKLVQRKRMVH